MIQQLLLAASFLYFGLTGSPITNHPIDVVFAGDAMMDGSVKRTINRLGPEFPFRNVKKEVMKADLAVVNLETSITQATIKDDVQLFNFKSDPVSLDGLKWAGFDLVSMANNHVLDYKQVGLFDTFKYLDQHDLDYVGAGKNESEAYSARTFIKEGKVIKVAAFARFLPSGDWFAHGNHPGVAEAYETERVMKAIEREKEGTDYLIVFMHWGIETNNRPEAWQRAMARNMIDAGADAIVGSHPHVLQGFEFHKDKPIAYSIGNFLFPDYVRNRKAETGLLHLKLDQGKVKMSFTPYYIRDNQIVKRSRQYDLVTLKYLERLSYGVRITGNEVRKRES